MTEYVIVLSIIMVCSVVGLLKAGSAAINRAAHSTKLCVDCEQELTEASVDGTPKPATNPDGTPADGTPVPDVITPPAPPPTFWSSISSWWENSYLANFMGLFGWFAFW